MKTAEPTRDDTADPAHSPFTASTFDVTDGLMANLTTLALTGRVLLGQGDLPAALGDVPGSTLAALFAKYGPPPSILAGRRRLYRRADLEAWAAALPAEAPLQGRRLAGAP